MRCDISRATDSYVKSSYNKVIFVCPSVSTGSIWTRDLSKIVHDMLMYTCVFELGSLRIDTVFRGNQVDGRI